MFVKKVFLKIPKEIGCHIWKSCDKRPSVISNLFNGNPNNQAMVTISLLKKKSYYFEIHILDKDLPKEKPIKMALKESKNVKF